MGSGLDASQCLCLELHIPYMSGWWKYIPLHVGVARLMGSALKMNIVSPFIVYLDLHKADSALGVYIAGAETTNISMLRWWLEHNI